jgi:hypothetical protein
MAAALGEEAAAEYDGQLGVETAAHKEGLGAALPVDFVQDGFEGDAVGDEHAVHVVDVDAVLGNLRRHLLQTSHGHGGSW